MDASSNISADYISVLRGLWGRGGDPPMGLENSVGNNVGRVTHHTPSLPTLSPLYSGEKHCGVYLCLAHPTAHLVVWLIVACFILL